MALTADKSGRRSSDAGIGAPTAENAVSLSIEGCNKGLTTPLKAKSSVADNNSRVPSVIRGINIINVYYIISVNYLHISYPAANS
jgi:hypothetical protein